MSLQGGMHRPAQVANALAVDDAHFKNPALPTFAEVVEHEVFHFARLEGVQVQHSVNRQLNRFVVHARM